MTITTVCQVWRNDQLAFLTKHETNIKRFTSQQRGGVGIPQTPDFGPESGVLLRETLALGTHTLKILLVHYCAPFINRIEIFSQISAQSVCHTVRPGVEV